jgi:hypothetical protein
MVPALVTTKRTGPGATGARETSTFHSVSRTDTVAAGTGPTVNDKNSGYHSMKFLGRLVCRVDRHSLPDIPGE